MYSGNMTQSAEALPFIRNCHDEAVVERFPVLKALNRMPDRFEENYPYVRLYLRLGARLFNPAPGPTGLRTQWTDRYHDPEYNMMSWREQTTRGGVGPLTGFVQCISSPQTAKYEDQHPLVHLLHHVADVDAHSTALRLGDIERVYVFDDDTRKLVVLYQNAEAAGDLGITTKFANMEIQLSFKGLAAMIDAAEPRLAFPDPSTSLFARTGRSIEDVDTSPLL